MDIISAVFRQAYFPNFLNPNTANATHKRRSATIVLAESVFLILIFVLALHAPLTLFFQQFNIPFSLYLVISPVTTIFGVFIAILLQYKKLKQANYFDPTIFICLFLTGLICSTLSAYTQAFIKDDYLYIPNAVYYLQNPSEPMDFGIHFLVSPSGTPIISHNQGTSLAYEYFRAVIAHYLKTDFLNIYFLSDLGCLLLLPLAYFLLITRFEPDPRHAYTGTVMATAFMLISLDGRFTYSVASVFNLAEGKRFVLVIGIPLFSAFTLSFFSQPTFRNWLVLLACTMAMTGMTASTISILSVLSVLLLGTFILTFKIKNSFLPAVKKLFLLSLWYSASLGYIIIYALFLYVQLRRGISTQGLPLGGPEKFLQQLELFSRPDNPLFLFTPILIVLCPLLFRLVVKNWQSTFLISWTFLLALLILNPIAKKLWVDIIVPKNIYWRMFFLSPFPISAGIATAYMASLNKSVRIVSWLSLFISVVIYTLVMQKQSRLDLSIIDLPMEELSASRQIVATAPKGPMLSPDPIYGLVPMVDSHYPQISTRIDATRLWFPNLERYGGHLANALAKDVFPREKATKFAGGEFAYINEFADVLRDSRIKSVVLRRTLFTPDNTSRIYNILRANGFLSERKIGDYLLVWK